MVAVGVFVYQKYLSPILKNNSTQRTKIVLNKDSSVLLFKKKNQGKVYSLEIEIEGNSSEIIHLEIGESEKRILHDARIKNGNIDFVYSNDWYIDSCYLRIEPSRKSNSKLNISYRFLSLD